MRKISSLLACSVFLIHCQEPKDGSTELRNSTSIFRKDVGSRITNAEAFRWINQFRKTNFNQRQTSEHHVSRAMLDVLLNPTNDKLGVVLQHALDYQGQYHILIIPYREGSSIWSSEALDVTTGTIIHPPAISEWAEQYKMQNPDGPWSHYFGIDIFETIRSNPNFNYLELVNGVNDNGLQQVIVFAWNNRSGNHSGRSDDGEVQAYDASWPCPASGCAR